MMALSQLFPYNGGDRILQANGYAAQPFELTGGCFWFRLCDNCPGIAG